MLRVRPLALFLIAAAAGPAFAVKEGSTYQEVIAEKGEPRSRMELGDTMMLTYADETIRLKSGKVVSVKPTGGTAESATSTTLTIPPGEWTTNYASAVTAAKADNRQVFLFFTGSDWCGWCRKLDREVLSTPEFKAYAQKKLVLVKLDFPRQIPQSNQLKAQNQKLGRQYKIEGYPTVIVLNAQGKQVGRLGYQPGGPKAFINELKGL